MSKLTLVCVRCGTKFLRELRAENYRINRRSDGPYCSGSCASRLDNPRLAQEPDPVPGAKWLPLTRGKFALVDEDVFADLMSRKWHWQNTGRSVGYAISGSRTTRVTLHHVVSGVAEQIHVDHKNNNGLDCRRDNLRVATKHENGANRGKFVGRAGRRFTSKYKGVVDRTQHLADKEKPWLARIRVNKQLVHLGRFATEYEAAVAYDTAAIQHFGEFAHTNFSEKRSA